MPQTTQTEPVTYHWIISVHTSDGRQASNDGRITAIPGVHTHESTYAAVKKTVTDWLGTDDYNVIFFSLTPNQIQAA